MTGASSANPLDRGYDPAGAGEGRDYLIRSEERLRVSTERMPYGVARLEKFLVTEVKTFTVEVTREEVRLVQEAAPQQVSNSEVAQPAQANTTNTMNTARWMYVNQEEVVITKRIVPVERVRLEVYPVTEQRQFTEVVRKEQVEDVPTAR